MYVLWAAKHGKDESSETLSAAKSSRRPLGSRTQTHRLLRLRLRLTVEDVDGGGGAAAVRGRARVGSRVRRRGVPHEQVTDGVLAGLGYDCHAPATLVVQYLWEGRTLIPHAR